MILLYTVFMFLLNTLKLVVGWRARGLERKYARVAAEVDKLARQSEFKPGNSGKPDPCLSAKRTLLLGQLVQKRDRVEAKHFAWQRWADRLAYWVRSLREWKGKKLPYTLGAVDVWMLLCAIDYLGVGDYVSIAAAMQMVNSLFAE